MLVEECKNPFDLELLGHKYSMLRPKTQEVGKDETCHNHKVIVSVDLNIISYLHNFHTSSVIKCWLC